MRRMLLSVGLTVFLAGAAQGAAAQHISGSIQAIRDVDNYRAVGANPDFERNNWPLRPQRVCPLVKGASAEVNAYVTARLRQVAQDVGAPYAQEACEPNLVILFSAEPDRLVEEASRLRRINFEGVSRPDIERFKASSQPVRWMHGKPMSAGRTARPFNALVLIDANKTAGVKVSALADYVSLVALADVRPEEASSSSILNLFDGPAAPQAMTEGDRAYLRAVYRLGAN